MVYSHISYICATCQPQSGEAVKLIKLLLVCPASVATAEQSFRG